MEAKNYIFTVIVKLQGLISVFFHQLWPNMEHHKWSSIKAHILSFDLGIKWGAHTYNRSLPQTRFYRTSRSFSFSAQIELTINVNN